MIETSTQELRVCREKMPETGSIFNALAAEFTL